MQFIYGHKKLFVRAEFNINTFFRKSCKEAFKTFILVFAASGIQSFNPTDLRAAGILQMYSIVQTIRLQCFIQFKNIINP